TRNDTPEAHRSAPTPTANQFRSAIWLGGLARPEADQAAGALAGGLAPLEGDLAGHQGGDVAVGLLDEAAAAGREVVDHLRRVQVHAVEVDEVHVGPLAGGEDPAVAEAVGRRGARGLEADGVLEAEPAAPGAAVDPVREQVGRHAHV